MMAYAPPPGVLNTLDLKAEGIASNETERRGKNKVSDLKFSIPRTHSEVY